MVSVFTQDRPPARDFGPCLLILAFLAGGGRGRSPSPNAAAT
mgnify:CR=1 FL=1